MLTASIMLITAMVSFFVACLLAWFGCQHKSRAIADLAALAAAETFAAGDTYVAAGIGQRACVIAATTATANGASLTACRVDSNGYDFKIFVTVVVPAKPHLPFGPEQFSHSSQAGSLW